jgi:hypothetical protein
MRHLAWPCIERAEVQSIPPDAEEPRCRFCEATYGNQPAGGQIDDLAVLTWGSS